MSRRSRDVLSCQLYLPRRFVGKNVPCPDFKFTASSRQSLHLARPKPESLWSLVRIKYPLAQTSRRQAGRQAGGGRKPGGMFVGGKPDRRAENYGDAAVEVWCEGSGTAPRSARTPAAAPLTAAAPPPRPPPELAADLPGLAAYSANRAAWRAVCGEEHPGGALPPPFLRDPRSECPRLDAPFVTDEVGGLPVLPDDLEQALAAYLSEADEEASSGAASAAEAPEVGLDGSGKAAASSLRREGLRALLREADAQGQRYWAAVACPRLRQPPWWPPAACGPGGVGAGRGSVPLYDQVIVGLLTLTVTLALTLALAPTRV